MRQSLAEYIRTLGKGWFAIVISAFAGFLGVFETINKSGVPMPPFMTGIFPAWIWFAVSSLALVVASFVPFHKMRDRHQELQKQYDAAVQELVSSYEFQTRIGLLRPLSPGQKLEQLKTWHQELVERAVNGDKSALPQLTVVAELFVKRTEEYYATGGKFAEHHQLVRAGLERIRKVKLIA